MSLPYLRREFQNRERWKNSKRSFNPPFGILTNIGEAHSENFPNREEKLKRKA
jgi:UDP-N-acetylmuramyl pentapeptide synthase